ncbi:MAG TPA: DUF6036 family nucleotidyltransferase, partial [Steroidobacteraceae bacterium]|nr:DUF6036 family nucleotidyltransferase [Steroidobacteraceae bacterium]
MTATGPGQSPLLLADVAAVLNSQKIDYAVVGALAVAVHGMMRASIDADAIVAATTSQLAGLQKQLVEAGFDVEQRRGGVDDPIAAMIIIADRFGNRVDLLIGMKGLEGSVYERAIQMQIPGFHSTLKIVGREDLIAMKIAAGAPKDLLDAEGCIRVAGKLLDVALVRRLAKQFGQDAEKNCAKLLPR